MNNITHFIDEVHNCLKKAFRIYDIRHVTIEDITIDTSLRGKCAGQATIRRGEYGLRFNTEAINKYYDHMVNDTIPHEVAHLICFINPRLGKNHDKGWKRVCRSLGGDDARTHTMNLSPAKKTTTHKYLVQGEVVELGPKRHAKLQKGITTYRHQTLGPIEAHMYMGDEKPTTKKIIPVTTGKLSKKQRAQAIFDANTNASRADVINEFIKQLDMTKAGASTYYYNCQKESK